MLSERRFFIHSAHLSTRPPGWHRGEQAQSLAFFGVHRVPIMLGSRTPGIHKVNAERAKFKLEASLASSLP